MISGSFDFAAASATTSAILTTVTSRFPRIQDRFTRSPNDLALVWGGANDFRNAFQQTPPLTQADFIQLSDTASSNITESVANLIRNEFQNIAVISTINIGAEVFYSSGESGQAEFDAFGFGLDTTLSGSTSTYRWELGLGLDTVTGELERDYNIGTFEANS